MSELDDLEQALREAGGVWFRDDLLLKLERLIEIARQGEQAADRLNEISMKIADPKGLFKLAPKIVTGVDREGFRT